MPAALERELRRRADALGLRGDRRRAYIYGTLARIDRDRPSRRRRRSRSLLERIVARIRRVV